MDEPTDAALAPEPMTTDADDREEPSEDGAATGDSGAAPRRRRLGRGNHLSDEELERQVAALVFASPDPLTLAQLVELCERPEPDRVTAALESLATRLVDAGLPLQIQDHGGGFAFLTTVEMGDVVARLGKGNTVERVSAAALETLAVMAYRQPVTKAEIEAIRGVQAGPVLRSLVDRGLARVVGRADVPGHPLQYGTTKHFLDRFGLASLKELPRDSELARD